MLMGAVDRGTHAEHPVDLTGRVRVDQDLSVDPISGAVPLEPTMPPSCRLARVQLWHGSNSPGRSGYGKLVRNRRTAASPLPS